MSHNQELENQDLHPTTGDNSHSANLPAEELPEQDLDTVAGGIAVLGLTDELVHTGDGTETPMDEKINGLPGDMLDLNKGIDEALSKIPF